IECGNKVLYLFVHFSVHLTFQGTSLLLVVSLRLATNGQKRLRLSSDRSSLWPPASHARLPAAQWLDQSRPLCSGGLIPSQQQLLFLSPQMDPGQCPACARRLRL